MSGSQLHQVGNLATYHQRWQAQKLGQEDSGVGWSGATASHGPPALQLTMAYGVGRADARRLEPSI